MEIVMIGVDQVDASGRLRPIDEDYATMIGASMAQHGQRAPIEVLPLNEAGHYPLISGAHRLRGAQLLGMATIAAIIRPVSDLQAEPLEIDENLTRHELNELDRAVFLERRQTIWEELYPETKQGGNRRRDKNDKLVVLVRSFAKATAEKLGCSPRTVERAVARARNIVPAVREMIGGSWIARKGAWLDAIARLDAEEQRAVVRLLTSGGQEDASSFGEALRIVRQAPAPRVDVVEQDFQKLLRLWKRADVSAREKFREYINREASRTQAIADAVVDQTARRAGRGRA